MAEKEEKFNPKKAIFFELFESAGFATSTIKNGIQYAEKLVEGGKVVATRQKQHRTIHIYFRRDTAKDNIKANDIIFSLPSSIDFDLALTVLFNSLDLIIDYLKNNVFLYTRRYTCYVFIKQENHAIFSNIYQGNRLSVYEHFFSTKYGFSDSPASTP